MLSMAKQLLQLQAAATAATHRRSSARRRQLLSPLPARHASAAGPGRFASCFLACLLALAAGAALALCVTLHRPNPDAASPRSHGGDSGYAVVINTWKRYGLLKRAVAHYSGCAGVDAVHVVWSEPREPPEALRRSVLNCSPATGAEVRFAMNRGADDSLNNRFRPVQGLRTDAVFSVDDDLLVPCSTLRFAFGVWRSAPSAMVGFVPRMHWPAVQAQRSNAEEYKYGSWWSVWRTGTYSMVLSKASFLHRRYLDLYTNHMLPTIRDYVTDNRNCEDIAMSFLVANVTGAPPIWVQGRIFEIGSTGISSLKGHDLRRSKCLNAFASMYGHMPLVSTTVKAVDSRTSWFW